MRFLLIAFFIIVTTSVHAQYKVYGTVYGLTGEPISNTQVSLHQGTARFITQSNGKGGYVFEIIANGSYQIKVNNQALKDVFDLTVTNDDLNFDYIPNAYFGSDETLDDLVIQVESVKSKLEKEGFAVNIIETKEAALRNIQTNELLDRSAGVRVRQNGGIGSAVEYNLNGMSGNSVKIFVDGIPISTYGSSFSLNSIPPALIERIEVYKGVVPIHLSDDALGGAINVVLKKGLRNSFNASLSYGFFNTWQGNFSGVLRTEKSGLTLKASSFYNFSDNDYKIWGKFARNINGDGNYEYVKARRFNDAFHSLGGRVEVGFTDVKWADNFMLGLNASNSYKEIQHGVYMTVPYMGRFTESDARVTSLTYQKKNLFTSGLDVDFNGMISTRQQVVNDTVSWVYNWNGEIARGKYGEKLKTRTGAQQGEPTLNTIDRNIQTLRAGVRYEFIDNHTFVLNHVLYNVTRTDEDLLKTISQRSYAATNDLKKNITSLGYEMKAFESKLKANAFAKFYKQNIHQTVPTAVVENGITVKKDVHKEKTISTTGYGVASSYLLTPSVVVLASAEKAVRLPSEGEVFGDPSENMISNTALNPEICNNYNLGFKVGPYKYHTHQFSVGGSVFLRDTKDKIIRQVNDRLNEALQASPFENLGKSKALGYEAEISYTYKNNLTFNGSMSYFKSYNNMKYDKAGKVLDRYKEQLPNEPFLTANGSLQYTLNNIVLKESKMLLNYAFGFVESYYTIWSLPKGISNRLERLKESETPRQFIQDLGFSYVFPKNQWVLSFDAKNIFNKQAYDNFAVQKPGRAFYLKINYTFNKF